MPMLKTFVTATAVSGLLLSGALAQTVQPTPPAATPPTTTTTTAPASPNFVAMQTADQWMASKFNGTDVLGPNNEKVGDVNDVLFDKSGKIIAVIVGVGGFLGIGQKDVALDMTAFQIVPAATTENTGSSAGATNDPNDIKLKIAMTKDQLKEAPSFERYRAPARTTGSTGTTRPATPAR